MRHLFAFKDAVDPPVDVALTIAATYKLSMRPPGNYVHSLINITVGRGGGCGSGGWGEE